MTDKEIKSAMEACLNRTDRCVCTIEDCPYAWEDECSIDLWKDALDLINRQQAEIERLKEEHDKNFEKWEILDKRTKERYAELYEEAKGVVRAKAVKEFAEKMKEIIPEIDDSYIEPMVEEHIDKTVKEMVGAE